MKHIKKFDTALQYAAYESSLVLPNVSLIEENDALYFKPYIEGHDYVEIGGIKWATMNVGANSVTDLGLFFQWADTQGYAWDMENTCFVPEKVFDYDYLDYKYYDEDDAQFSKYNYTDNLIELESSDDAVTAAWGGNWRMPTYADFDALEQATTQEWVDNYQNSGINGLLCTDKTDNTKVLFFPAAGYGSDSVNQYDPNQYNGGEYGEYWSKSLNDDYPDNAQVLYFNKYTGDSNIPELSADFFYKEVRYFGLPIRGILDE